MGGEYAQNIHNDDWTILIVGEMTVSNISYQNHTNVFQIGVPCWKEWQIEVTPTKIQQSQQLTSCHILPLSFLGRELILGQKAVNVCWGKISPALFPSVGWTFQNTNPRVSQLLISKTKTRPAKNCCRRVLSPFPVKVTTKTITCFAGDTFNDPDYYWEEGQPNI